MTTSTLQRIVLARRPDGEPTATNFRLESLPLPTPGAGEILLRVLYLSLDPYMRGRMNDRKSYVPPLQLGELMDGGTVAQVVQSRHPDYQPGDIVLSHSGWQTYAVASPKQILRRLDATIAPISTALGVYGMPGFTAWSGLGEIGKPKAGDTVVVAAASGPVGGTVGQIARLRGARTIGIAGGLPRRHRRVFRERRRRRVGRSTAAVERVRAGPGLRPGGALQRHRVAARTRPLIRIDGHDPQPQPERARVHPA